MSYVKQAWEDSPSTTTPLSAARLLYMENGIGFAADKAVSVAEHNPAAGTADNTTALQAAIDAGIAQNRPVFIDRSYSFASTIKVGGGSVLFGTGRQTTQLTYTGTASAIEQKTELSRIYGIVLSDFLLTTASGNTGLDLNSVSTSTVQRVQVQGFSAYGVWVGGPNGYSVYNTFMDVTAQSCPIGFQLGLAGSNSNRLIACRANICTTAGVKIADSNQNVLTDCQIEGCGTGLLVTASANALSDDNLAIGCRFEGNTLGWHVDTVNVRDFGDLFSHMTGNTTNYTDLGARTGIQVQNPPFFAGKRTTTLSGMVSGAFTAIPLNADDGDSHDGHSPTNNASRYVSRVAGWYQVNIWASQSWNTGNWALQIWKNGAVVPGGQEFRAAASNYRMTVSKAVYLAVNDYVELRFYQDSGADRTLPLSDGGVSATVDVFCTRPL